MRCSQCHTRLPSDAQFCIACGAKVRMAAQGRSQAALPAFPPSADIVSSAQVDPAQSAIPVRTRLSAWFDQPAPVWLISIVIVLLACIAIPIALHLLNLIGGDTLWLMIVLLALVVMMWNVGKRSR
jgi:hypothetical protein